MSDVEFPEITDSVDAVITRWLPDCDYCDEGNVADAMGWHSLDDPEDFQGISRIFCPRFGVEPPV